MRIGPQRFKCGTREPLPLDGGCNLLQQREPSLKANFQSALFILSIRHNMWEESDRIPALGYAGRAVKFGCIPSLHLTSPGIKARMRINSDQKTYIDDITTYTVSKKTRCSRLDCVGGGDI